MGRRCQPGLWRGDLLDRRAGQQPGDLVEQAKALFLELLQVLVGSRGDLALDPVNFAVDLVVAVGLAGEVGIGQLELVDQRAGPGKFLVQFVGDMAHLATRGCGCGARVRPGRQPRIALGQCRADLA